MLRKKRPYLEFFWSTFSPNAGKCEPETLEYGNFLRSESEQEDRRANFDAIYI